MRVKVKRELCVGSGQCVLSTPELFDQSPEDGRVLLREEPQGAEAMAAAEAAVELCPSGALSMTDD